LLVIFKEKEVWLWKLSGMVQYSEISFGIGTYPTEIFRISILQLTFGIGTLQFIGMGMWSQMVFDSFKDSSFDFSLINPKNI